MAARIVWWVLTLVILAVFHLSVTKELRCRSSSGCLICKNPKATKDHCLVYRLCLNISVCIKHDHEEEKRTCGIQPPEIVGGCLGSCAIPPRENILGGSPTKEGNWPWHVSLRSSSFVHICGGVLIDKDWVLTTKQCFYNWFRPRVSDLMLVLGEFDLNRISGKEQLRWVKPGFVHPKYNPKQSANDVALIQLKTDAHYNEFVSPICLPSFNDVYSSNSCYITGWLRNRVPKGDESRLRVLKATLLSPDDCKNITSGKIRPKLHICVNDSLTGACHVASDGPLTCARSSDGRFVVAGLPTNAPSSCKKPGHPSVYTNIGRFVPWINNKLHSTKDKL